jgi:cytochrome c-type biogenesis protein
MLGGILFLAADQDTLWTGVGLLTVYSAGLAVPFLISALALDRFLQAFKEFRRFLPLVEKSSGVLLIMLGILLITGHFAWLAARLSEWTPGFIYDRI